MLFCCHGKIRHCSPEVNELRSEERRRKPIPLSSCQQELESIGTAADGPIVHEPEGDCQTDSTLKDLNVSVAPHPRVRWLPGGCRRGRISPGSWNLFGGAHSLARPPASRGNRAHAGAQCNSARNHQPGSPV